MIHEYTDIPVETSEGVVIGKAILRVEGDYQESRAAIVIDSDLAKEAMKALYTGKFGEVWIDSDG